LSRLPAPPHAYTLSLHDALPISAVLGAQIGDHGETRRERAPIALQREILLVVTHRRHQHLLRQPHEALIDAAEQNDRPFDQAGEDRKSTRLNSSHVKISYAVFCL